MITPIIQMLSLYRGIDLQEELNRTRIMEFIQAEPCCFERTTTAGHITASAFVLNHTNTATLLTHHRKLGRWLQLGGHCDGDSDVLRVAKREVAKESGLTELTLRTPHIFDVDIHTIPARNEESEHLHYDIRFLFQSAPEQVLQLSSESLDLAWVPLKTLGEFSDEISLLRMRNKVLTLLNTTDVLSP